MKIINKKYDNKYITITGNKQIKINKIFHLLSNHFKIPKKKIKFLNEKYTGHYNIKPTTFKSRIGKDLIIKKQKNFKESLLKLINEIKGLN